MDKKNQNLIYFANVLFFAIIAKNKRQNYNTAKATALMHFMLYQTQAATARENELF